MFDRLACFTDIHYGRSSNNVQAISDNHEFLRWFIDLAKSKGYRTCMFLGDFFDQRQSINVNTLNEGLKALELINSSFDRTYFLISNHDIYFRDSRKVNSMEIARHLKNIHLIRDPTYTNGVALLPWLVGEEHKTVKREIIKQNIKYVFAHLELGGFMMNSAVEAPFHADCVQAVDFEKQGLEYVFSGHFHSRSQKGNVIYLGSPMPFNFSDNWNSNHGCMFLDWGAEPEFVDWPDQPLYRTMRLSELLDDPKRYLVPRLTARVNLDVAISYEEAEIIKNTFIKDYGLRKVEFTHDQTAAQQTFSEEVEFQSVDQIVLEGLASVQSIGFKPEALMEIYRNLL